VRTIISAELSSQSPGELAESFLAGSAAAEKNGRMQFMRDRARLKIRYPDWDSGYFGCPTYKLEFSDWDQEVAAPVVELAQTIPQVRTKLARRDTQPINSEAYPFLTILE